MLKSSQEELEAKKPGATIIPVILSSDKTQVTTFRGHQAYPVYLTIGNLPKEIRRKPSQGGQILLGYLPTGKLEHISNKSKRKRVYANVFHACMRVIVEPIKDAGEDGVLMASGDGATRRVHPLYAAYCADYPEQLLVNGLKNFQCPTCGVTIDHLGDYHDGSTHPYHDLEHILSILALADDSPGTAHEYSESSFC